MSRETEVGNVLPRRMCFSLVVKICLRWRNWLVNITCHLVKPVNYA